MHRMIALSALTLAIATTSAFAQPPATRQDYMASMQAMQQAMMKANDHDSDRAFALTMIEHHRGAISMGEVLMKHGDDVELKAMASKGSDMQKKEIAALQGWLDRHGGRAPRR